MESEVYPEKLTVAGLEYVRPNAADRDEINHIIMDELVYGVFRPEAIAVHQQVMGRLKAEGCDAVVLGCTEIPLIMNDDNSPLPTLDYPVCWHARLCGGRQASLHPEQYFVNVRAAEKMPGHKSMAR